MSTTRRLWKSISRKSNCSPRRVIRKALKLPLWPSRPTKPSLMGKKWRCQRKGLNWLERIQSNGCMVNSKEEKYLMKKNCFLLVGTLALLPVSLRAAEDGVRYNAVPNSSKVKVDGTSTLHNWSVESTALGGYVEFDAAFDFAKPALGKASARAEVRIFVRQLKSDKTDMDNVMYD